jgi:hypothetical protein
MRGYARDTSITTHLSVRHVAHDCTDVAEFDPFVTIAPDDPAFVHLPCSVWVT